MNITEKEELLKDLASGRVAILAAVSGLTDEVARRNPAPGRWSVLECIEHVAVAEQYLLEQVEGATLSDTPLVNTAREKSIRVRGLDRTTRIEAPDAAKPTGRFATLQEAADHFGVTRARTLRFVEGFTEDPRSRLCTHPLIGTVNTYETLLTMTAHPHRHTLQIREILATVHVG